jgi:hypothetical protein
VEHDIIQIGSCAWDGPGQSIYNTLKGNPNLFLMLAGHNHGECRRTDLYNGNTVHTVLSDYQDAPNGGDGWLRLLEFTPNSNTIKVSSYSPKLNQWNWNGNTPFTLDYTMTSSAGFQVIGTNSNVPSGSTTSVIWSGLNFSTQYEWYVTVSDGTSMTTGPTSLFTTQNISTAVTLSSFTAATLGSDATVWMVIGLGGVLVIGRGAFAVRKGSKRN